MKNLSALFILLLILSACEKKSDEKTTTGDTTSSATKSPESTNQIKQEIDLISDSLNTSWKKMISTDDQKIADIQRLLLEISYTGDYDVVMHDSLSAQVKTLKSKRYDETINLDQMDAYDQETDNLIRKVLVLKGKSKEIKKHPLADELVQDINNANSVETTVAHRNAYDYWAKAYNNYITTHRTELQQLGEPYASMKPKAEIVK